MDSKDSDVSYQYVCIIQGVPCIHAFFWMEEGRRRGLGGGGCLTSRNQLRSREEASRQAVTRALTATTTTVEREQGPPTCHSDPSLKTNRFRLESLTPTGWALTAVFAGPEPSRPFYLICCGDYRVLATPHENFAALHVFIFRVWAVHMMRSLRAMTSASVALVSLNRTAATNIINIIKSLEIF
jgi:hypothetical protein